MKAKTIAAVVLLAGVAPAMAAGPNYNYVEVAYDNVDIDGGGSIDGFDVAGSFAINDSFHVTGGYQYLKESPLTLTGLTVAGGYNLDLNETTDLVARLGLARATAKISGFGSGSDNGFVAQAGVRSMINDSFELNGFVTHVDAGGSETALELGAVYRFANNFGVTGGLAFSDDATTIRIGGRFSF